MNKTPLPIESDPEFMEQDEIEDGEIVDGEEVVEAKKDDVVVGVEAKMDDVVVEVEEVVGVEEKKDKVELNADNNGEKTIGAGVSPPSPKCLYLERKV